MDTRTESRVVGLLSLALALFGVFAPYRWHEMPPAVTNTALLLAGLCALWALWLVFPRNWLPKRVRVNSYLIVGAIFSICAIAAFIGYAIDRSRGPIIWTWGPFIPLGLNGNGESVNVFALQLHGKNRGDMPITPTDGFVESNIDGTKFPLTFSRKAIQTGVIPPEAEFDLVAVLPSDDTKRNEGLSISGFKRKLGSFRMVFVSPQKTYSMNFDSSAVEKMLTEGLSKIQTQPPPTVIFR